MSRDANTLAAEDAGLVAAIRDVLLARWDPITLGGLSRQVREANADEYDGYIEPLLRLIRERQPASALEAYLLDVETREMGVRPSHSRARAASEALTEVAQGR